MKAYYEQDGITIYHGDCRDIELPSDSIVLTDPPYGAGQKIAYDVYRDYMPNWIELMTWLLSLSFPMAFTMSHTRLFDLPKRPQWIGCWDKTWSSGIVHIGASPSWEPVCFYNMPAGDRGKPRWDDVFRVPVAGFPFDRADDGNGHPCPKPVDLYKKLLRVFPVGVVVDPMFGSGTTLRAAKDARRRAIGCDLSERYCEIAVKRLRQSVLELGA